MDALSDRHPDSDLDLAPVDCDCLRCGRTVPMRFRGLCPACRDELVEKLAREGRVVEVADYEPPMHVTPNAVATKE